MCVKPTKSTRLLVRRDPTMRIRVRASADSQKGGGDFESDKPPVLTLVRRDDRRVQFLVCEGLQDADEDIAEYGDGSVILCTDGYGIYDDIEELEGDGHLAVTHSDTCVIGDAHTNTCENRHSFLRQWLAKFRGVTKHHLQKCLNFLALKLNSADDWLEELLCYHASLAKRRTA
jgi:hypothetical protein